MSSTPAPTDPLTTSVKILGIVAFAAFSWSVYEGWSLGQQGASLKTAHAPRRIVSLALASTTRDAQTILNEWRCSTQGAPSAGTPCAVARESLDLDARFIAAYTTAWILIPLWALVAGNISKKSTALVIAAIVAGALFDVAENSLLAGALTHSSSLDPDRLFRLARLAAMHKFVLLLLGIAGGIVVGFGAMRKLLIGRWLWKKEQESQARAAALPARQGAGATATQDAPITSFRELVQRETDGIFETFKPQGHRTADTPVPATNAGSDEQYVSFREADIIGLALSGGGIRSATFNLGLLQELHCLRLLRLVDYVSTVSGGGYIGSFWSAWLKRLRASLEQSGKTPGSTDWNKEWNEKLFPTVHDPSPGEEHRVESNEERHLREFSGFLAPRWGFFEVETWTAIVALLAGLVPALLIGLSAIGITLIGWLSLTFPLASREADGAPAVTILIVSGLVYWLMERMWQRFRRETSGRSANLARPEADAAARGRKLYGVFAVAAALLVAGLQFWLRTAYQSVPEGPWPIFTGSGTWHAAPDASGIVRWWAITGIENPERPWIFSPRLFDYGLVWLVAGLGLIAVRTTSAILPRPWRRESLAAFDRVLMRTLGMGAAWIGLALLWHVSMNLTSLVTVAISAAISGGIFAALRNWIGVALRRPSEAGVLDRLKPALPALLAYLTLILTAVTVGGVLIETAEADWFAWWTASAVMTGLLVIGLFITPDEFGMHAFYRDRIARAYAGATNLEENQGAIDNRGSEPRDGDDPQFTDLVSRPLHLVCCAANDLSGDQVETLNRGARSAVLSKHGFSIGRYARAWQAHNPANRLGSGITASAAAFNSNMGHISIRVGPAVSFLMTMLNLRLGLWVRHPLASMAGPRRWPGLLYFREMLGLTSASGRLSAAEVPQSVMRDIHLSDGGHFENLALYELVRRHCRYIIVSDCGADPTVAFDDLGNALRRIREDFGVDVELDVSPLRPDEKGLSKQHIAIGKIRYSEIDTGILLYVKPAITGDEPPDVQQYRTRNLAFPHEGTTDQFYDEAQWESYRRLGRHAAEHIFEFVRRDGLAEFSADWVFAEASRQWGPTPDGLEDRVLEMTRRFAAVDAELQHRQQQATLKHVFPEMADAAGIKELYTRVRADGVAIQPPAGAGRQVAGPAAPLTHDAEGAMAAELSLLLRVTQVMEDVWVACQLDRWWGHPLNLGWINLFARWATSPPFQFWWPLLGPMFSPGFRTFIQQRFPVDSGDSSAASAIPRKGTVEELTQPQQSGLAAIWWEERSAQPARWNSPVSAPYRCRFYQNLLDLKRGPSSVRIQVGLAAVIFHESTAGWNSDDFFVPPSLWGAGIGGHFLRGLLERISQDASWCLVVVKAPPPDRAHQVARDDRQAFVEHYKKVGFREKLKIETDVELGLGKELGYNKDHDTLLTLDLGQWRARVNAGAPQRATG